MAGKSLVFLGICLVVAVSQSGAASDYNMNNQGYNNNKNNNNDNNGRTNSNGNSNSNKNNNNDNFRTNRNGNSNSNNNGNSNGNGGDYGNNNVYGNSNGNANSNSNSNSNNNGNTNQNNQNRNNNYCKALEMSRSLNISCTSSNGDVASCFDKRVAHGTKAKLNCKKNYVVQDETMIPEMTCQNGAWNRELKEFKCISVPIAVGYNYTIGQGFYKFHKFVKKWDEAKKMCENEGGHLLIIDSPEERDAANSTLVGLSAKVRLSVGKTGNKTKSSKTSSSGGTSTDDLTAVYIGYSDMVTKGEIMSVKNETMNQGWCDAAQTEKALAIKKTSSSPSCVAMRLGSLCYILLPCNSRRNFICEIEPAKAIEPQVSPAKAA